MITTLDSETVVKKFYDNIVRISFGFKKRSSESHENFRDVTKVVIVDIQGKQYLLVCYKDTDLYTPWEDVGLMNFEKEDN